MPQTIILALRIAIILSGWLLSLPLPILLIALRKPSGIGLASDDPC